VCAFVITAAQATQSVGVGGGDVGVALVTQPGCAWSLAAVTPFVTAKSGSSTGTGSATLLLTVASNPGPVRTGIATLHGFSHVGDGIDLPITIKQDPLDLPPPTAPTFLWFASSYIDTIGLGTTRLVRPSDATFSANLLSAGAIDVAIQKPPAISWILRIAPPTGQTFSIGTYANVTILATPTQAGLDFSGDGRGCDRTFGSLTILDLGISGGTVDRLHVTFEQHCDFVTASPLIGEIWFVR
jgi:hypothetical protein